jgi:hypothetical protein
VAPNVSLAAAASGSVTVTATSKPAWLHGLSVTTAGLATLAAEDVSSASAALMHGAHAPKARHAQRTMVDVGGGVQLPDGLGDAADGANSPMM